jgi:DNA-binding IclR family transcriptional regulator
MQDVYEATHQIVHLGVLDGTEILYVDKIHGRERVDVPTEVGWRVSAHCTAIGKAMLAASPPEVVERLLAKGLKARTPNTITEPAELRAELRRTAIRGVAFDHEEGTLGVACVASAIRNSRDEPVAGISITGPVPGFEPSRFAHLLQVSALAISRELRRNERNA